MDNAHSIVASPHSSDAAVATADLSKDEVRIIVLLQVYFLFSWQVEILTH